MIRHDLVRLVVVGVVLGLVAGAAVWWLRRFEVADLHRDVRGYLERYDRFRAWEAEHGGD